VTFLSSNENIRVLKATNMSVTVDLPDVIEAVKLSRFLHVLEVRRSAVCCIKHFLVFT
jgi:hypothetical protein